MSTYHNLEKQELPVSECRSGGVLQVPAWGTISVFYTSCLLLATLLLVVCLKIFIKSHWSSNGGVTGNRTCTVTSIHVHLLCYSSTIISIKQIVQN